MLNLVIEAEFDGRNFIARQPVDLPAGQQVRLIVQPVVQVASGADLVEYWRRFEVIGAWSDRKGDSAILARKLRQKSGKTSSQMKVVDTDILIDVFRGFVPALEWFATLSEPPAVVSLSVMELVQGYRSRQELQTVLYLVAPLTVWYPAEDEMRTALELFQEHHLRYRTGIFDTLIGVCVARRGGTLCTFNVRHYQMIPDLLVCQSSLLM